MTLPDGQQVLPGEHVLAASAPGTPTAGAPVEVVMAQARVVDNGAAQRFELTVGGELVGEADYEVQDGTMLITHVGVQPRYEGHGLGSQLTRAALDAARERGLDVVPICSFARSYVRRNPEYADLVPLDQRALVGLPV
jgi:predicted GNAT family acetyltransferase